MSIDGRELISVSQHFLSHFINRRSCPIIFCSIPVSKHIKRLLCHGYFFRLSFEEGLVLESFCEIWILALSVEYSEVSVRRTGGNRHGEIRVSIWPPLPEILMQDIRISLVTQSNLILPYIKNSLDPPGIEWWFKPLPLQVGCLLLIKIPKHAVGPMVLILGQFACPG
jgi:hypothetical protein